MVTMYLAGYLLPVGDRGGIHHLGVALGVAFSFNLAYKLFWVDFSLVRVFYEEGRLDDAQAHIERAKSHAVDDAYLLACALHVQAQL